METRGAQHKMTMSAEITQIITDIAYQDAYSIKIAGTCQLIVVTSSAHASSSLCPCTTHRSFDPASIPDGLKPSLSTAACQRHESHKFVPAYRQGMRQSQCHFNHGCATTPISQRATDRGSKLKSKCCFLAAACHCRLPHALELVQAEPPQGWPD